MGITIRRRTLNDFNLIQKLCYEKEKDYKIHYIKYLLLSKLKIRAYELYIQN